MLLDVINLNIKCLMIDCLYSHYIWLFVKAYYPETLLKAISVQI